MSFKHPYWNNISSDYVYIYSAFAITDTHRLKELSITLAQDELIRANRFRFEKDRAVYITARWLLRNLIGGYYGIAPNDIKFEYSEFGRPSYLKNRELDFNVSHSGNQIVIGLAKNRTIGVDIEKIKKDFEPLDLAKNFFSKEEIEALQNEKDVFRAFYRCWTRKESFIKAVGEGLSYPLDSFAVTLDSDEHAAFLKIDSAKDSEIDWQLSSFVPSEKYIAAITISGRVENIKFFDAKDMFGE